MNSKDFVCLKCVGDKVLRDQVSDNPTRAVCASCRKQRLAVRLDRVAERVDEVYRAHFTPSDDLHGIAEPPQVIIQEIAEVESDIADGIVAYLHEKESHDIADGDDAYYDDSSLYLEHPLEPVELHWEWGTFCQRVKHERRFFDDEGRSILAGVLSDADSLTDSTNPISVCVTTFKRGTACYRARRAENHDVARRILENPRKELSPPSPGITPAGRMNPNGIPVFYGGFSSNICIAEVRPYVGGLVVVGEFRTLRSLRLFDLTQLEHAGFAGSMFGPQYDDRVMRRSFLRAFHHLISRPVQPHEEAIEYLPTQAVAEYIANVLGLDGIVYDSAQLGAEANESEFGEPTDHTKRNLAFFNRSSLVRGNRLREVTPSSIGNFLFPGEKSSSISDDVRIPSLHFVKGSAKVVKITSIAVSHEHEYLDSV